LVIKETHDEKFVAGALAVTLSDSTVKGRWLAEDGSNGDGS
jgi:hypothetical protein